VKYRYHIFLDEEALCIDADGWTERGNWMGFYYVDGLGQETTFPTTFRRIFLRAKPERRQVEVREHFHWVRHSLIRRIVIKQASAIEAPSGGETTEIGSTEDESAAPKADAQ